VLVDPNNLNVIKCKLCDFVVKAVIYRLKQHVAGIRGEVRSCPAATDEDKAKCNKVVDDSKKAKKGKSNNMFEMLSSLMMGQMLKKPPLEKGLLMLEKGNRHGSWGL